MNRPFDNLAMGWKPGWTARAFARPRPDDTRFSDEDILTILRAGDAGLKVADLCAASDIPAETYYRWKAMYGGLGPAELRAHRERERTKGRTTVAVAAAMVAGLAVAYALTAARGDAAAAPQTPAKVDLAAAPPAPAPASTPAETPVSTTGATPAAAGPGAPAARPPEAAAVAPRPVARPAAPWIDAADIETADPGGYAVQIAAVPDLAEARVVLEKLAASGYPAFITTRTVGATELYRVRVGPLKSKTIADDIAHRLEREGYRAPWITR